MGFTRTRPRKGLGGTTPQAPAQGTAVVNADRSITYTRPNTGWASELLVDGERVGDFGYGQDKCVAFAGGANPLPPVAQGTAVVNADRSITYIRPNTAWASDLLVDGERKGGFLVGQDRCVVPAPGAEGTAELPRVYLDTRFPAVTGRTLNVAAGGDLQAALNDAQPGDQVVLQAGATFTGSFKLPRKTGTGWIVIRSSGTLPAEGTRVRPRDTAQLAKLVTRTTEPVLYTEAGAHHYRLVGLELCYAESVTFAYTLVELGSGDSRVQRSLDQVPTDIVIDRSYIHGHPALSFQRGVGLNSARTAIIDSWISECHGTGMDSQAISGWNGPGPYKIVNNHLAGAGENVMFGGSDSGIPDLVPSDIEFRGNHVFKPLSWRGVWTVKNIFELKNGARVLVEGNVFENNWLDAQTGFAILFTPRNQDGGNPWAVVRDVTFRNNIVRRSGSAFMILGYDYNHPSQVTTNIVIENNSLEEINGGVYGGHGTGFIINQERPSNLVIRNNTIGNSGRVIQLDGDDGTRKLDRLVFTGNAAASGYIGAGAEGGTGALNFGVTSWTVSGNVLAGVPSSIYPAGNAYPSTLDGYTGPEGVDRAVLDSATAGVIQAP